MARDEQSTRWSVVLLVCVALYVAALFSLRPASPFEWDEVLFQRALDRFDIAQHSPHPPGYPVYVAVGRILRLAVGDPMNALQIASILAAALATMILWRLARHLGASRLAAAASGAILAATPAFAFYANVGLSDVMATAAGLATVLTLVWALEDPSRLPWAALTAALSTGVRPQLLALIIPIGLVVAFGAARERGHGVLAKSLLAGAAGTLAVWVPAALATGPRRFLDAFGAQMRGVIVEEGGLRLPGAPVVLVAKSWLLDPFGAQWLGLAFWLLVGLGAWSWLRTGNRTLVAVAAGAGGSYLLAAMWLLNLTTAARYMLPALPFLALLAAGTLMLPRRTLRCLSLAAVLVWTTSAALWLVPVCRIRSEPAPLWAALGFVEHSFNPGRTTVLFDPAFLPHVEYLLERRGFNVVPMPSAREGALALARPGDDHVLTITTRPDRQGASLFARSWKLDRLARLTGGRYEACVVSRLPGDAATWRPASRLPDPLVLQATASKLSSIPVAALRVPSDPRRVRPFLDRAPMPPAVGEGVVTAPAAVAEGAIVYGLEDGPPDTEHADVREGEVVPFEPDEQTPAAHVQLEDFDFVDQPSARTEAPTRATEREPPRPGRSPTTLRGFSAPVPPEAKKP